MPKQDLVFSKPMLNAAGSLGFDPDLRVRARLGFFRRLHHQSHLLASPSPAQRPQLVEYPGGVLIHSGLPNPGFRGVLKEFSRSWMQSPVPIVVNLIADRPEETREMVRALESQENILAIELGFAPLLADDIILLAVEMSVGELPIIVGLPANRFCAWDHKLRPWAQRP